MGSSRKEIKHRISVIRSCMASLNKSILHALIRLNNMLQLYKLYVLPVSLYIRALTALTFGAHSLHEPCQWHGNLDWAFWDICFERQGPLESFVDCSEQAQKDWRRQCTDLGPIGLQSRSRIWQPWNSSIIQHGRWLRTGWLGVASLTRLHWAEP